MKKYFSRLNRKNLINKIAIRCSKIKKHDVRASFGEDCEHIEKDMFIFWPKHHKYFVGEVNGVYFKYINDTVYCFNESKNNPNHVGVFKGTIENGKYASGSDLTYFSFDSKGAKAILTLSKQIDETKQEQSKKNIKR